MSHPFLSRYGYSKGPTDSFDLPDVTGSQELPKPSTARKEPVPPTLGIQLNRKKKSRSVAGKVFEMTGFLA